MIQTTQLVKEQFDVKLSVAQLLGQLRNIDSLANCIDEGETPKGAPDPASNPPDPGGETPKIAPDPASNPPDPGPQDPKIAPDSSASTSGSNPY